MAPRFENQRPLGLEELRAMVEKARPEPISVEAEPTSRTEPDRPHRAEIKAVRAADLIIQNARTFDIQDKVYAQKIAGTSEKDIAVMFGLDIVQVENIITTKAENARVKTSEAMKSALVLELERMDAIHRALWPKVMEGDLYTIDRVMKLGAERRRLLGLDAPEMKASLNLSADATVDLSSLTLDELKSYEAIVSKLQAVPKPGEYGQKEVFAKDSTPKRKPGRPPKPKDLRVELEPSEENETPKP